MAFSHLCWQLSHLGRGEAVLSTQCGGQDALACLFALCVATLPSAPGETGGMASICSSASHCLGAFNPASRPPL